MLCVNTQKLIGNRISAAFDNFSTAPWHTFYEFVKVIFAEVLPCLFQTLKQFFLFLASAVYSISCLALPTNFVYDSGRDFALAIQAFQFVDL